MLFIIRNYFLLFLVYSIIGWILEVSFTVIRCKQLTNRGFLIGPYCPIYGVGCISMVVLLSGYTNHPVGLFVLAVVLCSVLEYYTSYFMEKLFKARWWDYSDRKFNINGRICLETMIPFGIGAFLIIYIVNPYMLEFIGNTSSWMLTTLTIFLLIIFILDLVLSFNIINSFKQTVKKVTMDDKTDDINKYIKDIFIKKSVLAKRLIEAFPRIQTKWKTIIIDKTFNNKRNKNKKTKD